jgi:glycosyltransferase involved in cell wall biosynthesis
VSLRVLLVIDFYAPFIGGGELQTQLLAEELARRGHAVTVATVWHSGLCETEMIQGVTISRLRGFAMRLPWAFSGPRHFHPPAPDPLMTLGLVRLVRRFRPDVVHATGWIAYSTRLATMLTRRPLVVSARDFGYACPIRTLIWRGETCTGPRFEKCLRHSAERYGTPKALFAVSGVLGLRHWLVAGAAGVHVASRFVAQIERRDLLSHGDERIALIPNMIRPASTPSVGPVRLGQESVDDATSIAGDDATLLERLPPEPFILFVGALQPHKGIEPLLSAYSRLKTPPPLVVVGTSWPDSPKEWPDGVTVLTDIPNPVVQRIWDRSLFGVAPSLVPETFGGAVVEAMQHGRPIVASSLGGPLDTVEHGRTGFLVPPGDVNALSGAMQALVDDPVLRERMGSLAREEMQRRFAVDIVVPQFEALYARVASEQRRR